MDNHPLRSEIIATALASAKWTNEMGCNFVTRLQEETGANIVDIANACSKHPREILRSWQSS